jgi:hypothetical protein
MKWGWGERGRGQRETKREETGKEVVCSLKIVNLWCLLIPGVSYCIVTYFHLRELLEE